VLGALAAATFIVAPLTGWLPLVRVAPVLVLALLVILAVARPWTWSPQDWAAIGDWNPSRRTVRITAVIVGLLVFWFVLTRFRSADINAVDFTVYYERPNFQTLQGHPLYVESADDPLRAYRSLFAIHAHWIMLPLALFYAVWASPLWLLALSVVAVVAGAIHTLRIVQSIGAGGPIASASALAFVFNANTARTLNYGFHAEVLYAWFVPWMIHAGVQRRWRSFLIAALLVVAVKEDAFLLLIAGVVALLLFHRLSRASDSMPGESRGRMLSRAECAVLLAPAAVAIENLSFYFRYAMPRFSATGKPFYSNYWGNYGPTMVSAMVGMLSRPFDVLSSTITSGFLTHVLSPYAYLPFIGWRWSIGILPIVLLYGAAANEQMRSFGIYYAIPLVPFLALGAADGARRLADRFGSHRGRARTCAAAVILAGALLAGISDAGYSLRPWKPQVGAVPRMLRQLNGERFVLVQSALYPHAGYDERVQLLTSESLREPRYAGAALLLAPGLSTYPLSAAEFEALSQREVMARSDEGLLVVRLSTPP
jgi:uncharacterized membrane protein